MTKINQKMARVGRNAAIIAIASLISRLLGLFRDRVLASEFGAGAQLDSYYAAFRIPDLVFNLLILGALSAALIPIFSQLIVKDEAKAWRVINNFGSVILALMAGALAVISVFAPWLIHLITPGFEGQQLEQTVLLTRIMMLSPVFFALSSIAGGVLNSFEKFFVYSIAPIFYNLGIILGALYLAPHYGIVGVACGVVLGACAHFLVQVPTLWSVGYRPQFVFNPRDPYFRKILYLMLPVTLGLGLTQINIFIDTVIGSWLTHGSIAILNFASNLVSLPVGLIGISFAVSVFPALARAHGDQDEVAFANNLIKTFTFILYLLIPIMVLSIVLRAQVVRLVLGAGLFDVIDTIRTSRAFGYLALGIVAQGMLPFLVRIFYAVEDTRTPLKVTIVSTLTNAFASAYFAVYLGYGVVGLAIGTTLAAFVSICMLLYILKGRFPRIDINSVLYASSVYMVMSIAAGMSAYGMLYLVEPHINTLTTLGLLLQTIFAAGAGVFAYLLLSAILKINEADRVISVINRALKRV